MKYRRNQINEISIEDLKASAKKLLDIPVVKNVVDFFSGDDEEEDAYDEETGETARPGKSAEKEQVSAEIADAALESIPLSDALRIDSDKRALIVGGSQAGVIGPDVMRALEATGKFEFDFNPQSAKSMNFIYSKVAVNVRDRDQYDVVIIFPGYKPGEQAESVVKLIKLFTPARCFVVIPPPVTEIVDTTHAMDAGLNRGMPVSSDFWFLLGGGNYARERENYCKDLRSAVEKVGATFIDPRDVVSGGTLQQSGVTFPPSLDGIHIKDPPVVSEIADAVVERIKSCTLPVPVTGVLAKIDPEQAASDSSLSSALASAPAAAAIVGRLSSKVGMRDDPFTGKRSKHQGLDIGVRTGTPVRAALAGKVTKVVPPPGSPRAGVYVEVTHDNGDVTRYLHLSKVLANVGDEVETGDTIALSGNTGRSTGPHLHWETWEGGGFKRGRLANPLEWLTRNPGSVKPVEF